MQTFFITANDTDVGKTYVTGLLARHFSAQGKRVQIVKAIDCGGSGDAELARTFARSDRVSCHTLLRYPEPLAPLAESNSSIQTPTLSALLEAFGQLPDTEVRLIEGAGGIAVPIDPAGLDWRDFAEAFAPDRTLVVVDNRLGAINQSRLLHHYLTDLPHAFILNEVLPADAAVKRSNRQAYRSHALPLLGQVDRAGETIDLHAPQLLEAAPAPIAPSEPHNPFRQKLETRKAHNVFRQTKTRRSDEPYLNLADNDYLGLSQHPEMIAAGKAALDQWGTSASASPLITGYTEAHHALENSLSAWYGGKPTLLWNSGYAANQCVLNCFVQPGDLVIADRLIHHSLIAGILQSGARLVRFLHNDLQQLEALLRKHSGTRTIHLVTESVYSMDGDYPDLQQIAYLKSQYGFKWLLDEAHAVGWYGPKGAGLAEHCGVLDSVDILTGTLGKALASAGAYTVFSASWMRDYCVNEGSEFIYSTYLPPASAAIARQAIDLIQRDHTARQNGQAQAVQFRQRLRDLGWKVPGHDSPIVPVICGVSETTLHLAQSLLTDGFKVGAIRPPTVPAGSARLRLSLKSTLTEPVYQRLVQAFETHRPAAHA